jgi:Nickel-dependent hydrogenase
MPRPSSLSYVPPRQPLRVRRGDGCTFHTQNHVRIVAAYVARSTAFPGERESIFVGAIHCQVLDPFADGLRLFIGLKISVSGVWIWKAESKGFGFTEAPRGALCHWIQIKDQKIANYQIVVPSTWNASPKDGKGQHGAYESALIGTPMADPKRPVEILRTIHSFDPCLACASHVIGPDGETLAEIVVR